MTSAFNALAHAVEALWDPLASPNSLLLAENGAKYIINGLNKINNTEVYTLDYEAEALQSYKDTRGLNGRA